MPKPTVLLDETAHPIEQFIYLVKLHTGEDLVIQSLEFIDLTKAPKKSKLYRIKNPTVLMLMQTEEGRYVYVPQPWIARSLIEGDWFTLFGSAIAGWCMPSKEILTIYKSAVLMLEQMRQERLAEKALLEEQASIITKIDVPKGTANTVTDHSGPVTTSKVKLNNSKLSLEDFTETFKKLKPQ